MVIGGFLMFQCCMIGQFKLNIFQSDYMAYIKLLFCVLVWCGVVCGVGCGFIMPAGLFVSSKLVTGTRCNLKSYK